MDKQDQLYLIRRQIELLGYRADRLKPGPRRAALVRRIEGLNIKYGLVLGS
jgi:hypothetical protein